MSIYGEWETATIATAAKESSEVDLGRDYDLIELLIPGLSDACKLSLKVSNRAGGTFYSLGKDVTTDEEAFGRSDVWKLGGFRHIKIVSSKKQTAACAIKVRGTRS